MQIPQSQPPQVPSVDQVTAHLDQLLAVVLSNLMGKMGVDGFTVNSLGTIMSKLKWDGKQTQAEIKALIWSQAQAQVDEIKVYLLKASIETPLN